MLLSIALLALLPTCFLEIPSTVSVREDSARKLTEALTRREAESAAQRLARLSQVVVEVHSGLGMERGGWMLTSLLERAASRADRDAVGAVEELSEQLAGLAGDLRFEPLIEADLPLGFPAPTPVHSITRKTYPTYRMANTPSKGSRGKSGKKR